MDNGGPARGLMIQGTGSNVGKSLLVAGLCRAARLRGLRVLPFKPQNMSNNAALTADGGEIGRAQALQALACGVEPVTDMNPVLLKPESETGAQVIVQGRRLTSLRARDYAALKPQLAAAVMDSFARLAARADLVLVEGAGSPAEVNLRKGDIANMGFARMAGLPVVLAGDIDRGGVIAQIVGTQAVLDPADRAMIAGFIINRFRGDPRLFDDGYRLIESRTGWRGFGVVPWFADAARLPAEDALDLAGAGAEAGGGPVRVVCLGLSRIANFDDLDPLKLEPGLHVQMLRAGQVLLGDADLVIVPGTTAPLADLAFLRAQGWDIDLAAHRRRGGHILGLGAGSALLGHDIRDGTGASTCGLGFLDLAAVLQPGGASAQVQGVHVATGQDLRGHAVAGVGLSGPDCARPFARITGRPEGARSPDGRVEGTGLHGIMAADGFRTAWLAGLGAEAGGLSAAGEVGRVLDALAAHLESHLDVNALLALARLPRMDPP